jgi:cell wall-associated NlpC family hydrolase
LTRILIIFIVFVFIFSLYIGFTGIYKIKDSNILRNRIVQTATSLQNTKNNAHKLNSFDCSAYVRFVYRKNGIRLPRSSIKQYEKGRHKSIEEALPGDLIFFNTSGKMISHVGIYLGDYTFIHAGTSQGITVSSLDDPYWNNRFVGISSFTGSN